MTQNSARGVGPRRILKKKINFIMEGLISQFKIDYDVKNIDKNNDGSVHIDCGRYCERLDHYTCGDEDCSCDEAEGWCEDTWEEECVRPITKAFDEWAQKHVPGDIAASCSVGEKGYLYVEFKPKMAEPASKRAKCDA